MDFHHYIQQVGGLLIVFRQDGDEIVLPLDVLRNADIEVCRDEDAAPAGHTLQIRDLRGIELVRWQFAKRQDAQRLCSVLTAATRQGRQPSTQDKPHGKRHAVGQALAAILRGALCLLSAYLMLIGLSAVATDALTRGSPAMPGSAVPPSEGRADAAAPTPLQRNSAEQEKAPLGAADTPELDGLYDYSCE